MVDINYAEESLKNLRSIHTQQDESIIEVWDNNIAV
jgi:hypothetical protein